MTPLKSEAVPHTEDDRLPKGFTIENIRVDVVKAKKNPVSAIIVTQYVNNIWITRARLTVRGLHKKDPDCEIVDDDVRMDFGKNLVLTIPLHNMMV